jgi:mRNA interferase RelE/StbE
MKVVIKDSFVKDAQLLPAKVKLKVYNIIQETERISNLREVRNCKKLTGYKTFYRIRLGTYRLGINLLEDTVYFVCVKLRKDIYKHFP